MTENGLMESSQTEKLFYNNSHQKSFEATVLSCQKKENYYEIVLDQTAFFPEGGGQYADTGYLGDAKVLDVQEQEGQILHRTDQELPVGEKVTGQLDWELRFMKMQQHTGEHIVSGIVHERYGYENVGFHLGNEDCTMDFNGEIPVEEWLVFLSQDDPDMIMKLLDRNPEFQKIYEEIYTLCLNMEGMMEMFSKELEIMDRNTVKLMIDEMEEELNETKRKAKKEVDEVKRKAKEEIEEAEKRAKAAEEETERLRRTLEEQKGKRDIS